MDNDFNQQVITEFRANEGKVAGPFEGRPVLLLTTTGAKSGNERTTPVMYLPEDNAYYVFASMAGAPTSPAWYHNLVANPDVTIEVGAEKLKATRPSSTAPSVTACTRSRRRSTATSLSMSRRRRASSPS